MHHLHEYVLATDEKPNHAKFKSGTSYARYLALKSQSFQVVTDFANLMKHKNLKQKNHIVIEYTSPGPFISLMKGMIEADDFSESIAVRLRSGETTTFENVIDSVFELWLSELREIWPNDYRLTDDDMAHALRDTKHQVIPKRKSAEPPHV